MKKMTLFGLSLAGLALLAFPHSGQAFELKEEWVVKCGVQYQDGKILRFNNGHEVDIKVLDLPKTEKIEWTVSLNGQDQTVNFLGQEKKEYLRGVEGRYLNFYVPYGYRGDIKVVAKSGNEVKTWSTKVVEDVYNGVKRGYYYIKESNGQYTYLDTKWDYQTQTYTAILPKTVNGQKVYAWGDYDHGEFILTKQESVSTYYIGGEGFRELYPIVKAEGWLKSYSYWHYQKQGQLVQNAWVKDKGTWYFMNNIGVMIASDWLYDQGKWYYLSTSGAMKASTWVYDKGEWYYLSSSGAMIANNWVKDNGKWYYLASSGKMLRNTYTPDGYYVGNSGAWQ